MTPTFVGGVRVAIGDASGDGTLDIITAAGPGGGSEVEVIDGTKLGRRQSTGQIDDTSILASFCAFGSIFTGGVFVAFGMSNGRPEVICGAGASGSPEVSVFGSSGQPLQGILDPRLGPTPTITNAFASDIRVASVTLAVQSQLLAAPGLSSLSLVDRYNGSMLAFLGSFFPDPQTFTGGLFVAGG